MFGMRVSREQRSGNTHGIRIPLSRPYITGWLPKRGWPVLPGSSRVNFEIAWQPSQPGYLESRSRDRGGVILGWMLKGTNSFSCLNNRPIPSLRASSVGRCGSGAGKGRSPRTACSQASQFRVASSLCFKARLSATSFSQEKFCT